MEIRVLNYFLAVAREQSILKAAQVLHITQPTLSRQLKDLEDELGKTLFIRGNKKITLTDDGVLFRKRAEEIINLVRKTENEMQSTEDSISGDIYIGTGETESVHYLAEIAQELQERYPNIHYHIASDDKQDVTENLDKGLIDFGIVLGPIDKQKYNYITLPDKDVWGVLIKKDSELSSLKYITPKDLLDKPLLMSRQINHNTNFINWFKTDINNLNIVATYNLVYNASVLVNCGFGYAVTLDKLINTTGDSSLCFIPLKDMPGLESHFIWKKYQVFSKPAEKFLEYMRNKFENA